MGVLRVNVHLGYLPRDAGGLRGGACVDARRRDEVARGGVDGVVPRRIRERLDGLGVLGLDAH